MGINLQVLQIVLNTTSVFITCHTYFNVQLPHLGDCILIRNCKFVTGHGGYNVRLQQQVLPQPLPTQQQQLLLQIQQPSEQLPQLRTKQLRPKITQSQIT